MQFLLLFTWLSFSLYITDGAVLKSAMGNSYPQVAVLGCDSNKANLYYDVQRQVWVEHLVSSCVNDEQNILEFCQKAYPSLRVGNIIRLDTVLRFENWCELLPTTDNSIPRCKTESPSEELVQSYRCLHSNSKREETSFSSDECVINRLNGPDDCYRPEKWQQYAALTCSKKGMVLNNSVIPLEWCGLTQFRGVEFLCCSLRDNDVNNDYQTSVDEKDEVEDDPIRELMIVPTISTEESHRKLIASSLGSREPDWLTDSRQWSTDSGYFADDEDTNDEKADLQLSSPKKSPVTINEHDRFTNAKEEFRRRTTEKINDLKSRWLQHQREIQSFANQNPEAAQRDYEANEKQFRQEYETFKRQASEERSRINQLHENNLDQILDLAKNDTRQKLNAAWLEKPIKSENLEDALYNYLHVLLRDRIHLVNRYERLRVVEPEQAARKRVTIHERLRSIADQINNALNQLRRYSQLQANIQPRLNTLLEEYDEVNQAANKLLLDYVASLPSLTPSRNQMLPLGRDENKIYPVPSSRSNNNDDDYAADDDDYDDDDDDNDSSTTKTTESKTNNEQVDLGDSDWDLNIDPAIKMKPEIERDNIDYYFGGGRRSNVSLPYLPFITGAVLLLCIIAGLLIFRFVIQRQRRHRNGGNYEKNYVFTEVDANSPEEKALHALQLNGYENPTYKFFESQTPKC